MTPQEEMRSRLNPKGLRVTDVMADGFSIPRRSLRMFRVKAWTEGGCWLVLVASLLGLAVGIWAGRKL